MQAGSEPRSPATSTRSNSSECPQPPTWEVPPPARGSAGTGEELWCPGGDTAIGVRQLKWEPSSTNVRCYGPDPPNCMLEQPGVGN